MTLRTNRHRHAATAALLTAVLLGTSCGTRSTTTTTTTTTTPPALSSTVAPTAPSAASPSTSAANTSVATTAGSVPVTASAGTEVEQITANWERFFLPSTSIADRIALLENGSSLQTALEQRATDPLQQQASAHVKSVELTDSEHATVTYDVSLNGTVALADAQGTAVRQDGVWKVGAQSFCALITLGATAPIPGCS